MDPQRAIVALIIGPVLLIATYLGGWFYFVPVAFLMLTAGSEYSRIMGALKHNTPRWLLMPSIALVLVTMWWPQWNLLGPALFLTFFATLIYCLWLFERRNAPDAALDWFALVTGIVLLGWLGGHFFLLRQLPEDGWRWMTVALLGMWSADMAAYAVGSLLAGRVLGKHALAPRLSPKKTVEGYVGGIIIGTLMATLTALVLDVSPLLAGLAGLAVSVLGLFGDLSISLLKREAGMKDSGTIFRSHGGALDRLDSVIWAVAIVYYLVLYLSPYLA